MPLMASPLSFDPRFSFFFVDSSLGQDTLRVKTRRTGKSGKSGRMEEWKNGIMEEWKTALPILPIFQSSIIPSFHLEGLFRMDNR
jgi:hypothetical protein